jgi:hypothetical protein
MIKTVSQLKDELADREAIRDCLYRYSRGVDRLDADLLRTAYWPDAIDTHLAFQGTIEQFIEWAFPIMRNMDGTGHLIGNILIQLDGAKAAVESYFYGVQRINADGVMKDSVAAGRYLDHFERRNGEWRIAKRLVVTDWFRDYPDSADWKAGPFGMSTAERGVMGPKDSSYGWLGLNALLR